MAQSRKKTTAGEYEYVSSYDILSQTPANYSKDNYFLKELQEKVLADWDYRPNRADIEYEDDWGKQTYSPIDVVLQSVLTEKGTAISSDTRNIVFKNIFEDRFVVGSRFRFAPNLGRNSKNKDVWIAINTNFSKMTASVVAQRCNGTLRTTYIEDGVSKIHTEPVIQGVDLSSVSMSYNDTIVSPQSQLVITAQHNEFTSKYFINERFIVGYDRVYKIKAINKFYGNSTDDPHDVGVMKIYLEITEQSEYDDMENRIAYQQESVVIPDTTPVDGGYFIKFKAPDPIPVELTSELINFVPVVCDANNVEYPGLTVDTTIELEKLTSGISQDKYVDFIKQPSSSKFSLQRKKIYLKGRLIVNCTAYAPNTGEAFTTSIILGMSMSE